ncbi:MAG: hypothetical protein ACQEQJ_09535 [Halobacteriota archaeon]
MLDSGPFTVNLATIGIDDSQFKAVTDTLGKAAFGADGATGFEIEGVQSDRVTARLLRSRPVEIQSYDTDTGELVDEEVQTVESIPFRLDFDRQRLEVFSNGRDTRAVASAIQQRIDLGQPPVQLGLDLAGVYDAATETDWDVSVSSLQVRNLAIDEQATGSYRMAIPEGSQADSYIADYAGDISYLGTTFERAGSAVSVGFYESGSIRFFSASDANEELWETIGTEIQAHGATVEKR